MDSLSSLVLVVAVVVIYFAPSIRAARAHKRNLGAIFALNLFLGWTLIGWVVALVWALTVEPEIAKHDV